MISAYRKAFNANYRPEKYEQLTHQVKQEVGYFIDFKVAETPIFIPDALKNHLEVAIHEIAKQLSTTDYFEKSKRSIPHDCVVPNESTQPDFMIMDFAITKNTQGELMPQLIELQSFPTLFFFQAYLNQLYRKYYDIDPDFTNYFNGLTEDEYISILRHLIIGDHDPKHVILLEIEPDKQKTRIDFACCERMIGIKTVCLTQVFKQGRKLFYQHEGQTIEIKRIYNRVIFDELQMRTDLKLDFNLTDDVEVEWAGHPNWFFRMSKFSLPFLKSKYVPKTYFLNDLDTIPTDLHNYVLKPLFSFAGSGVIFDVTPEHIQDIPQAQQADYILMQKVSYEPLVETLDVPAKAEIRMMMVRNPATNQPELLTNLVRLSKGKMMGVDFNQAQIWVGGSMAYFKK